MMIDIDYPKFEDAHPQDVLRWSVNTFGEELAVVTSFQPTGIVTLHMLNEIAPDEKVAVLTLDTGLLFPETYALFDEIEARFNLRLIRVKPKLTVEQQAQQYGAALWKREPDKCCQMRKVVPLADALTGYNAWITGLRRDQSEGRATTEPVSLDNRYNKTKICPFATWTEEMIWTYIHAHDLPYNSLHEQGYPSIGCYPCTQAVETGINDQRAGRWMSHAKTECGIHAI